jgi:hypothetical protein
MLRNIYRVAQGLPSNPSRSKLDHRYADAVLAHDWPDMANGQLLEVSHRINEGMWKLPMSIKVTTPADHTSLILFKYNLGRGQLWTVR